MLNLNGQHHTGYIEWRLLQKCPPQTYIINGAILPVPKSFAISKSLVINALLIIRDLSGSSRVAHDICYNVWQHVFSVLGPAFCLQTLALSLQTLEPWMIQNANSQAWPTCNWSSLDRGTFGQKFRPQNWRQRRRSCWHGSAQCCRSNAPQDLRGKVYKLKYLISCSIMRLQDSPKGSPVMLENEKRHWGKLKDEVSSSVQQGRLCTEYAVGHGAWISTVGDSPDTALAPWSPPGGLGCDESGTLPRGGF